MRTLFVKYLVMALVLSLFVIPLDVLASTAGAVDNGGVAPIEDDVFDQIVAILVGWAVGGVGKAAAIACLIGGGIAAVMRANVWFVASAVALGLGFAVGPSLILGVFSATFPGLA